MIKALHVAGGLKAEEGGPSVSILNFCAGSAAADIQPHVATAISDKSPEIILEIERRVLAANATFSGFRTVPVLAYRARRWGISLALARWLRLNIRKFDVVVIHGAWLFSSVSAFVFARGAGIPCVLVPHESLTEFDVRRGVSPLRRLVKRQLKNSYLRHCNALVFASELERTNTLLPATVARSVVLHHPIFDDRTLTLVPPRARDNTHRTIGFLGRIDPKKNLNAVISALAYLPPQFSLVVGGDGPGPIKDELRDLARESGVSDRITWLGFVEGKDKDAFFQSVDLLVMPSAFESFGMSAAEAMVRGVPVVVSASTGIAELVLRDGGGVVASTEPAALASAILNSASSDASLDSLGMAAIHASRKNLSVAAFGQELLKLYRELLSPNTV